MNRFGIYVHIPHCLQLCHYCDFATVLYNDPTNRDQYTDIVVEEIHRRNLAIADKTVSTIYFGGGTPSLAGPQNIARILQALSEHFDIKGVREITLEINPGTIKPEELEMYLAMGINRFSVGIQTFNDIALKRLGREHSAEESLRTLELLRSARINYTMDLLYALPHQTLDQLKIDLEVIKSLSPNHVSAYILTLPSQNPLQASRPTDESQAEMFYLVEQELLTVGISRYEVSSFAKEGFRSKHNTLYWEDQPYWGIGMSSHSFLRSGAYGVRFWNPPTIAAYKKQVYSDFKSHSDSLPKSQFELLTQHESLTDFCHTRLRTVDGLDLNVIDKKYGSTALKAIIERARLLVKRDLLEYTSPTIIRIRNESLVLSEQVFQEMTFLAEELS